MTSRPVEAPDPIVEGTRRLAAGAPPPHVDGAVRAAARSAARRRRASAWTLPVALAATVLVAFSIVLQVQHDAGLPAGSAPGPADEPTADEPAAAAVLQEAAPPAAPPPMADASAEKSAAAANAAGAAPRALRSATPVPETPADWLARIEALEAAGRHEEAEAERRRLEEAHPGWLAEHAAERD